jgi:hypothetical protein
MARLFREDRGLIVFENRTFKRVGLLGPKREKLMGSRIKLHFEEINNVYISPHIIRIINLRNIRTLGRLACMEKEMRIEFLKGRYHLQDLDV